MTVLPIVERELRVAARRRGTYWHRAVSAGAAVLICLWVFLTTSRGPTREAGQVLFAVLAIIFFTLSLFLGMLHTADCLSEEKRAGTLGLLFLTDLKGYDVVLGKLAASSLSAFYGMLAILPVLAIPLLLGGVTVGEFGRLVAVLLNTLFFSLAAGLFASAVTRSAQHATALTFLLTLGLNALGPMTGAYLQYRNGGQSFPESCLVPSAGYACALAFDGPYQGRGLKFLGSLATTHSLGWLLLGLASVATRRAWRERTPGTVKLALLRVGRRWTHGRPEASQAFRRRLLDINPCFWLGSRYRHKPVLLWAFLGLIAVLWVGGHVKWPDDWDEAMNIATAILVHFVLKLWMGSEASQSFGADRHSGALELLLSTPLRVRDILRGQMLTLQHRFRGPVALVIVVDLLFMVGGWGSSAPSGKGWWAAFCLVGITTFLLDLYALAWLGLWLGLVSRQTSRAAWSAVALVLTLPWLVIAATLTGMTMLRMTFPGSGDWFVLGLYFAVGCGADLLFVLGARFRLRRDLRNVATRRFEPRRPLFRRWVSEPGGPLSAIS